MWQRALAFLIDLVPLMVLTGVENAAGFAQHEIVGAVNLLLLVVYFAGMNYQFGGTLGKRMLGLRVALPSSPNVAPQLIVRSFVKIFCIAPPLATVYGLVAIWREDGRSFADFIAGTMVVDVATLKPPGRLSLFGRLLATALALVGPWVLLIVLIVCLFGMTLIEELLKNL